MEYDERALQAVREDRLLINQYDAWLYDEFEAYVGRRIVEIGCGLGNLLQHLADKELVVGIEPSQEIVDEMSDLFVDYENVRIEQHSITDPEVLALARLRLDTAISLNVFEHIEQDDIAIRNTWHLLQPGGTFILIVPAHQQLYGTMDRSIGHYRRYTKAMLGNKMKKAGFRVLRQRYLNLLGAVGWWINGRLLRRPIPPGGQLRLLNTILPALKAVESRFESPLGVSVLTIAEKVSE
ncbi:MAG: class I SAM-dependent methyltransferase [Chloroflexota bacterium]|nr:MAG: class I SAM-dependent methyltransferase [Chloroflexota bacterium]